jgi:uncharacterized membrane protein
MSTTEQPSVQEPGPTPDGAGPRGGRTEPATETPERARRRRWRWRPLSPVGAILGVVFAAMSVTPSLVPRAWVVEALLSGVCIITGYAIGAFLGWGYRALQLPVAPARVERTIWRIVPWAAVVLLLLTGWLGLRWQNEQYDLLGMEETAPWLWVFAPLLGVLFAALFLGIGRTVRWVGRKITGWLQRRLPYRVAVLISVVVTGFLAYGFFSGFLIDGTISALDEVFDANNDQNKAGVVNPESPYRSGGPNSVVGWDSIGREGRQFVWEGPTAADISDVVGDPDAVEPVRAFVGLKTAPTAAERADIAVEELERLGGFERAAIAVAGGTGSGWIDPKASVSLEYAAHGDVATVSMQYSYLPSWMSFLVDQSRAQANAEELITAIRVALNRIPADERPELYVYGESLGAFSTDSAFTSVEDMSTTTDGALLIGPPSFDETWQKLVDGRDAGSPIWKPRYGDGALARVAATDDDLTDPSLRWRTDNRIIYLVHSSDPIVAWTADHGQWLDPRGPDVSPRMVAWPIVSAWQASVDQFNANGVPAGHGHVYDATTVTAWSQILGPPALPDDEITAIREKIAELGG